MMVLFIVHPAIKGGSDKWEQGRGGGEGLESTAMSLGVEQAAGDPRACS